MPRSGKSDAYLMTKPESWTHTFSASHVIHVRADKETGVAHNRGHYSKVGT